jgi:copper homeostasis protein (lipoprotein)
MNRLFLAYATATMLMLASCTAPTKEAEQFVDHHTSQMALDWAGTYKGTLPCADCEGIETTITINRDHTFTMEEQYLGKKDKSYQTAGRFEWSSSGGNITLDDGNRKQQYQVGENRLTHLDQNGDFITGKLAEQYILPKVDVPTLDFPKKD